MNKLSVIAIVIIACCTFLLSQCNETKTTDTQKEAAIAKNGGYSSPVKWGEHLVTVMSCGDCHTPKKMGPMGPEQDSSLGLSGHPAKMPPPDVDRKAMESKGLVVTNTLTAWVGPWGISYAANITSDTTGIGMWTEDQFIYCLRNGKLKGMEGSRTLLPPMPWQSFRYMTDDEMKAIFAYLKSSKPIMNLVPASVPPMSAH